MFVEEKRLEELIAAYKQDSENAMSAANANIGAAQALEKLLTELKRQEIGSIGEVGTPTEVDIPLYGGENAGK